MNGAARLHLNEAMARLADGDRQAFAEVFRAVRPLVEALARRLLGGGADAEDAAQQAMVKIFERASAYEPGRDAGAWVLGVCAWECRTFRKRFVRRREVELDDAIAPPIDLATPEQDVVARDLERAAIEVLGSLSDADRETLLASFDEERTPGLSLATFRKRKGRAIARLREAWRKVHGSD